MLKSPIIIASPARSGTTMVAGILKEHGVWIGEAKATSFSETNSGVRAENVHIKSLMKQFTRQTGYIPKQLPFPTIVDKKGMVYELRNLINIIVPQNTNWLVKTGATIVFNTVWINAFPEAKWIFIRRDIKDILRSMENHPKMKNRSPQKMLRFIHAIKERQLETMKMLREEQYITLDVDAVANRDMKECKRLIEFCGLTLNENIINEFVDPNMWYGKKEKVC